MRLGHRSVVFGDWRKYYNAVRVVRTGEFGGRRVYGIQLESAGLPPVLVAVDAETGDVLQTQQTLWAGESGALPTTTTYSDYREVGGLRVPHRYIESAEFLGRAIYQVGARRSWRRTGAGHLHAPGTHRLWPRKVELCSVL